MQSHNPYFLRQSENGMKRSRACEAMSEYAMFNFTMTCKKTSTSFAKIKAHKNQKRKSYKIFLDRTYLGHKQELKKKRGGGQAEPLKVAPPQHLDPPPLQQEKKTAEVRAESTRPCESTTLTFDHLYALDDITVWVFNRQLESCPLWGEKKKQ